MIEREQGDFASLRLPAIVIAGFTVLGFLLFLLGDWRGKLADLGIALLSAAVIAGVVYWLEWRSRLREAESDKRLRVDLREMDADRARRQHMELRRVLNQMTVLVAPSLEGIRLPGEDLQGIVLRNKDLSNANLRRANLEGADLTGCRLARADLTEANLKNAMLRDVVATGAIFCGSVLGGAQVAGAILVDCDFSKALVDDVDFSLAQTDGSQGL